MTYYKPNYTVLTSSQQNPAPGREEAAGSVASSLSKAHIRPRPIPKVTYREGSSYLSVTRGYKMDKVGGGKRRQIKGFSKNSRRRLMYLIAGIRRDADLPCFVTLTYPNYFPTVEKAKRDLKIFLQRLKRRFECSGIWKLEPQMRGAPHYHMLIWGVSQGDLFEWVCQNWYDIAGNGDTNHLLFHKGELRGSKPCVSKVYSFKGVWAYASKYIGKTFEVAEWGSQWTGRFWGSWGDLPQGELKEAIIPEKLAIISMRYQRRFARLKRYSHWRVTTFCNADLWVEKIFSPLLN